MATMLKIDTPPSFIQRGDFGKIRTVPVKERAVKQSSTQKHDSPTVPQVEIREVTRMRSSPVNKSTVLFVALGAYILFSRYGGTPQGSMPVSAFQWMSVALGIVAFAVLADLASGGKMGAIRLLGL